MNQIQAHISDIIAKAKQNDKKAIRLLFNEHVNQMFSTSYRITNDRSESEDIVQEAFVISFDKLDQLDDARNYQSWLRKIIINKSIAYTRKKKFYTEIIDHQIPDEGDQQPWYYEISMPEIKSAIQQLPNGCRTIFSLYAIENYKHKEIASELGISVGTSKSQYKYAKEFLKKLLTKK